MIIIYYQSRENGKFTNVHEDHANAGKEKLAEAIARYNNAGHTTAAGMVEVADNSLEAYLFETRNRRADIDRQAIRDAIDAIETALDNVRYLED